MVLDIQQVWLGPAIYQINLKGLRLGSQWSDWFEGMNITFGKGVTTLTGEVVDQAALHALLFWVQDLGFHLISVTRIDYDQKVE